MWSWRLATHTWDIDPQDWRRPGAGQIADHVIANAFPGAIVLFHDGGGDRTQTMEAMGRILPELAAQGYVFRNLHSSWRVVPSGECCRGSPGGAPRQSPLCVR
jgi:peptidoglycan/xylan/chitin deacetylase (PgdA/CDA1 family)